MQFKNVQMIIKITSQSLKHLNFCQPSKICRPRNHSPIPLSCYFTEGEVSIRIPLPSWALSKSEYVFFRSTLLYPHPYQWSRKNITKRSFFYSMNRQFAYVLYFTKIRLKKQRIAMLFFFQFEAKITTCKK